MNAQHIIPNTIMPDEVRLFHAIETASSNFIWGAVLVLVLVRPLQASVKAKELEPAAHG